MIKFGAALSGTCCCFSLEEQIETGRSVRCGLAGGLKISTELQIYKVSHPKMGELCLHSYII